jgi:hypothetical protein
MKRDRGYSSGCVLISLVGRVDFWVDPPGYFDDLVWPRYLRWNAELITEIEERTGRFGDEMLLLDSSTLSVRELLERSIRYVGGNEGQ